MVIRSWKYALLKYQSVPFCWASVTLPITHIHVCFLCKTFICFHVISLSVCTLEVLACSSDPCQNGATCFDNNGGSGYVCFCPAGFEGTNCENGTLSLIYPSSYSSYLLLLILSLHNARKYS